MKAALLAAWACCAAAPAAAVSDAGLQFLRLDIGPRGIAMGGAGTALTGDAYAAAYNPAAAAWTSGHELAFSHAQWLAGIRYQDAAAVYQLRDGAVAGRLQRLDYGAIPSYDATGQRFGSYTAGDMLVAGSYARRLGSKGFSAGATLKWAREEIARVSAAAVLADAGVLQRFSGRGVLDDLAVGLSVRNLGGAARFDSESTQAPREIRLGFSKPFAHEAVRLAADLRLPRGDGMRGGAGAEFWAVDTLALRVGVELPADEGVGIRAGFGFRFKRAQIDYAFQPVGSLGQTHHVGLRVFFGGRAESAYRAGLRLLEQERPAEAILRFNEALEQDPKHPQAFRRLRQAYERLPPEPQKARD